MPISSWTSDRLVDMPTGIHRHEFVFVAYQEGIYALKEIPPSLARHEYEILRAMEGRTRHAAIAVGHVERSWVDPDREWAGAVITQYVKHAFPYRSLVSGTGFASRRDTLLDAFAGLLVELHLNGFYWGDCSLSNVLYRWDASSIEAIIVDAETSRVYDRISGGQRREDLEIMQLNVAGEMGDIAAEHGGSLDEADISLGEDIAARYRSLWKELTTSLVVSAGDHFRIRQRIDRLHELGFAVADIDLIPVDNGTNVKIRVKVGGRQYHSERLREIRGIDISENQARVILSDLSRSHCPSSASSAHDLPLTYASEMHVLVATAGALSPEPVVEFARHLIGGTGFVTVTTVIEVPHTFLENLDADDWHPLHDTAHREPPESVVDAYLRERGHRVTDPMRRALEEARIPCEVMMLEGADPAAAISKAANDVGADVVILGATKPIFERDAWESVSAKIMIDSGRPILVVPHARKAIDEASDLTAYHPGAEPEVPA